MVSVGLAEAVSTSFDWSLTKSYRLVMLVWWTVQQKDFTLTNFNCWREVVISLLGSSTWQVAPSLYSLPISAIRN